MLYQALVLQVSKSCFYKDRGKGSLHTLHRQLETMAFQVFFFFFSVIFANNKLNELKVVRIAEK